MERRWWWWWTHKTPLHISYRCCTDNWDSAARGDIKKSIILHVFMTSITSQIFLAINILQFLFILIYLHFINLSFSLSCYLSILLVVFPCSVLFSREVSTQRKVSNPWIRRTTCSRSLGKTSAPRITNALMTTSLRKRTEVVVLRLELLPSHVTYRA